MDKELVCMSKKKIVFITPYLLDVTRGIERFCLNLADAMVKKNVEVIFYTWGQKKENPCGNINSQIKVRKVPYCRYYREQIATLWYRLWLKIDHPDATLLNFFYHGEQNLPKNGHYIYVLHSPASQIRNRYEYVASRINNFTNIHLVAISKLVEGEAKSYFETKPMSLIYNGTDIKSFQPIQNKPESKKLRIITPAAYEERKGMHWLINALADFKYRDHIQYDIYGSGPEEYGNYLKKIIHDNNLENIVTLKGSVTNIPEIEPQYDLFALLSKGEAFALSPIEAMACGLPILVSTCPPYPEFVKDDFGFMVARENPKEIQTVLTKLIENPNILKQMSISARKAAENFSWDKIVEQYINLI